MKVDRSRAFLRAVPVALLLVMISANAGAEDFCESPSGGASPAKSVKRQIKSYAKNLFAVSAPVSELKPVKPKKQKQAKRKNATTKVSAGDVANVLSIVATGVAIARGNSGSGRPVDSYSSGSGSNSARGSDCPARTYTSGGGTPVCQ